MPETDHCRACGTRPGSRRRRGLCATCYREWCRTAARCSEHRRPVIKEGRCHFCLVAAAGAGPRCPKCGVRTAQPRNVGRLCRRCDAERRATAPRCEAHGLPVIVEDRCSHCQQAFIASQRVCVECGRSPVDAHDRCAYHANVYRYRDQVCAVVDEAGNACTRPVVAKGLCSMHARRLRETGDTGPVDALIAPAGAGCLDKTTGYRYASVEGDGS
jgi:hypothetical protein